MSAVIACRLYVSLNLIMTETKNQNHPNASQSSEAVGTESDQINNAGGSDNTYELTNAQATLNNSTPSQTTNLPSFATIQHSLQINLPPVATYLPTVSPTLPGVNLETNSSQYPSQDDLGPWSSAYSSVMPQMTSMSSTEVRGTNAGMDFNLGYEHSYDYSSKYGSGNSNSLGSIGSSAIPELVGHIAPGLGSHATTRSFPDSSTTASAMCTPIPPFQPINPMYSMQNINSAPFTNSCNFMANPLYSLNSSVRLKYGPTANNASGVNQLGGIYANGRPLNEDTRNKIVALHKKQIRPCEISRRLKISHGCVSKILSKYNKTGSIKPGTIGGSKPRVAKDFIISRIVALKKASPQLFAWEIRQRLRRFLKVCFSLEQPVRTHVHAVKTISPCAGLLHQSSAPVIKLVKIQFSRNPLN